MNISLQSGLPFPQPLIGLCTAHDDLGNAIKALTHGPVEHAYWLCSDQKRKCEAFYPRVHCVPLDGTEEVGSLLFALEGMTPEIAAKLERFWAIATDPNLVESYSVKGLFGYLFNVEPENEQSVFCSQFVMQTIRKNCPELLPLVRCVDGVSPSDLYRSPRLLPVNWK